MLALYARKLEYELNTITQFSLSPKTRYRADNTGLTDVPHRPSSSDGHLVIPFSLVHFTYRLACQDARLKTPYRVRLTARTVRH